MTNNKKDNKQGYIALVVIAIVAVIALVALMQPRNESDTQLGRAVEEVQEGFEDAGRELKPERSTGEKIGDAIEDAGENLQDATTR